MALQSPSKARANPSYFSLLPTELLRDTFSHLQNRDIKSLRLTSAFFCDRAPLRLDRPFLSANPRNIEVLRAVVDHDVFRKGIVELIWDDVTFQKHHPRMHNGYDFRWSEESHCPD